MQKFCSKTKSLQQNEKILGTAAAAAAAAEDISHTYTQRYSSAAVLTVCNREIEYVGACPSCA